MITRSGAQRSLLLPLSAEPEVCPSWMMPLRERVMENWVSLRRVGSSPHCDLSASATLVMADCIEWLNEVPPCSIHAVVTDPPYGLLEYDGNNHGKLRAGRGGVWRIPPTFDGSNRKPLPRFTVLSDDDCEALRAFFRAFAKAVSRAVVPGGHIFVASNPLLSSMTFSCFQECGLEKRGEVIRLVQTLRGGDRPKGAEDEFADVSVMPRSAWEPWGMFRRPIEGTVADNLRKWGTGGLRRISRGEPFKDVIPCSPTRGVERARAPHPSLKPQRFLRKLVRASLPLGVGIVYDPFAGSASTLAAAEALGYLSIGTERDREYFEMGCRAFADLSVLPVGANDSR